MGREGGRREAGLHKGMVRQGNEPGADAQKTPLAPLLCFADLSRGAMRKSVSSRWITIAPFNQKEHNKNIGAAPTLDQLTFKVYPPMAIKRKPHHDLGAVKARFAHGETLEITRAAVEGARALGYSLADVVEAVQALDPGDFIKSETAHSPRNSRIWHDTYNLPWVDRRLY